MGQKIGMTRIYSKDGEVIPVTVVEAKPNFITAIKTLEKDGYRAVQIAYGRKNRVKKPQLGHLKKANLTTAKALKEVKTEALDAKVGDRVSISNFQDGERIRVSGVSKGKGFQGVIKRWGFHSGPQTHGSDHHRAPGSIGSMFPQRVFKGKKLPGHLGYTKTTVEGLRIVKIDPENNLILISGALPGPNKSTVLIQKDERRVRKNSLLVRHQ